MTTKSLNKNLHKAGIAKKDEFYTQLADIENGRMNPTLSTLEKISGALGISSSELLK